MQDEERKSSEADAEPGVSEIKPGPAQPGMAPRHSETEAQPDRPVPNERGRA